MNCGTPAPAEADKDEKVKDWVPLKQDDTFASDNLSGFDGSNEGVLVFCPTCGSHMQKSPEKCDKCGMILLENIHNDNPQSVPAFNPDSGLNGIGGADIFGIGVSDGLSGGMVSGGGMSSVGGGMSAVGGTSGSGGMESVGRNTAASVTGSGGMESIGKNVPSISEVVPDSNTAAVADKGAENVNNKPGISEVPTNVVSTVSMDNGAENAKDKPDAGEALPKTEPAANLGGIEIGGNTSGARADVTVDPGKPSENNDRLKPPADISVDTSTVMAVDENEKSSSVRQAEPEQGKERKVEDFSMSGGGDEPMSEKAVTVIEGGSMDDDSSADVEIDPYKFLNNSMSDMSGEEPQKPAEKTAAEPVPIIIPTVGDSPKAVSETADKNAGTAKEAAKQAAPPAEPAAEKKPEPVPAAVPVIEDISKTVSEQKQNVTNSAPVNDFSPEKTEIIGDAWLNPPRAETESPAAVAVAVPPAPPVTPVTPAPPVTPSNVSPENGVDLSKGNLVYCRNCGQDMYDTEKVCKNCNAPYKGPYVTPGDVPPSGGSDKSKKLSPAILAGIAAIAAVIIGLGIFIAVKANSQKLPSNSTSGGGHTASISDQSSSSSSSSSTESTSSSSEEPPVQSSDSSSAGEDDPISGSGEQSGSDSEPQNSSTTSSEESSSSSTTQSTSSTTQSSSTTTKSSSSTTRSSSSTQSSKPSSSSSTPMPAMTAKVQSLEVDRIKIMDAIAFLAGEMGKADLLVRHATYELDHPKATPETTIKNFLNTELAKEISSSINGNRITANTTVDGAKPQNAELNNMYQQLKVLQQKYIDCCNIIFSTNNANQYRTNANNSVNAFNSQLSSMGFSKFMVSGYTTDNKDNAYASVLRSTQTKMTEAANNLATVHNAVSNLGWIKFDSMANSTINANARAYVNAAAAAGRVNAYRIMLLGFQGKYSGSYSNISTAYGCITNIYSLLADAEQMDYNDYTNKVNQYIATIRLSASNINNAVK